MNGRTQLSSTGLTELVAGIATMMIVLVGPSSAGPRVTFDSGRLSIRTGGEQPLREVLEDVTEQTGVEFVLAPELTDERLEIDLQEAELERALRRLVVQIPGARGHTLTYVSDDSGEARVARVRVFGAGSASAESPASSGSRSEEAVAVEASADSRKERLVEMGVSPETAEDFVGFMQEISRLQGTPGAVEEIVRSERYRRTMHAVARAQGKGKTPEEEP